MRQSVALFPFTLLILLVADPPARIRRVRVLAIVLGIGLAVSHYSTAYLTIGAVLTAWLLGVALRTRPVSVGSSPPGATAGITGAGLIWGLLVADTGPRLRQVARDPVLGTEPAPWFGKLPVSLAPWCRYWTVDLSIPDPRVGPHRTGPWLRLDDSEPRANAVHLRDNCHSWLARSVSAWPGVPERDGHAKAS